MSLLFIQAIGEDEFEHMTLDENQFLAFAYQHQACP